MKKLALILVFLAGGSFVLAQQEQMQGHMMSADGEHAHDSGHMMSSDGMSGDEHMMHHGSGESCPSAGADSGQCPHGSRVQAEGMITLGMLEKETGSRNGPIAFERGGQSAFAAVQEIVALLEADPNTDWSKVDISALIEHLRDMDRVTMSAEVETQAIEGGMRFIASGEGMVTQSIQRMVLAHAHTMDGLGGWSYSGEATDNGAVMEVRVPEGDLQRLRALGFFGVLSAGMHHQEHHLMLAKGMPAH